MASLLRIFLPLYFVAFIFTTFIFRTYLNASRFGLKPYFFGKTGETHSLVARLLIVGVIACLLVVLVFALFPDLYAYLGPVYWLEDPIFAWIGIILCLLSLLWIIVAQAQMGASWRIGFDPRRKTALVTRGLFAISRNPIFLGMAATLFGLFLCLPNAFTFALLTGGGALIQVQVRLEEEYLRAKHGKPYAAYCLRVPRWL
ncbi:MAG: isoprenylcysteine carboxylmethyltransferase family protein [Anaerolineales bacterium]